jgi:choice-of-anchor B domain-containing protein
MRLWHTLFFLWAAVCNAGAQQSLKVQLLGNWNDSAHVRINLNGQRYNDVYGLVVKGKEYAAIGSTEGVHIIDIDAMKQVAFYPGKTTGNTVIHRDYKTYKHYLFAVCDEGISSIQVFDMNYLPDSLHLVYESQPTEFIQANKIFIDTAKATLYAATAKSISSSDQMRVYDISVPAAPALILQYNNHDNIHDMYVRNDTAFCSASFYGYEVVDCSNHGSWRQIGEMTGYPFQGYNHSSWIDKRGIGVLTDETHGLPVKVFDARDLNRMEVLSTFSPRPGDTTCIPHMPYIAGNFVFIAYYFDGLQIYDISDPLQPKQAGYYDTYMQPAFKGFAGAWGCYPFLPSHRVLLSDMQTGLYVLDVHEATGWQQVNKGFALYPNPVTDRFFIEFPVTETSDDLSVQIYNAAGQLQFSQVYDPSVYTYRPIQLTLPPGWPAGTYFVRILADGRSYNTKFSKL